MNDILAEEALVQSGKTQLFSDLISLYEECQEKLFDLKNSSGDKYNLKLKEIGYPEKLKGIVKKHMGINIYKVEISELKQPNAFASINVPQNIFSNHYKGNKSLSSIVNKINSVYDDKSGMVDYKDDRKLDVLFSLCITIGLFRMRFRDGKYYFSPEEIAAITIHELGHYDHWIRSLSSPISRLMDASDLVNYISDNPSSSEISEIFDKIRNSTYLDSSWKPIVKLVDKSISKFGKLPAPEHKELISNLESLIIAESSGRTLSEINLSRVLDTAVVTGTAHSDSYILDIERSADDFSSRHGAYQALSSIVKKIDEFRDKSSMMYVRQFMWFAPAVIFSILNQFSALFDVSAEDMSSGYDPIIRRLQLISQTAKHAFSQTDLPDDIKKDISDQIKYVESYIKERESSNFRIIRKKIKDWKTSSSKFGRLLISPIHNRQSSDYKRIHDATRDLGRHSLYYLAEK